MIPVFLLSVVSMVATFAIVVATTPGRQLAKWAEVVQIGRAIFLLSANLIVLALILCWFGGDLAMRQDSRYAGIFNSQFGVTLLVSVGVTAMTYYATLSVLLLQAVVRRRHVST